MPGRKYHANPTSKYRFSINGQEKESDLNENITTALYWEYDSRIMRRWNLDPRPDFSLSPYSVFNNNPLINTDFFGDTLSNGQVLAALEIANTEILRRTQTDQGFGLKSKDYINALNAGMTSYLKDNPLSKGDLVDFYNKVHKYYDAFAGAAIASKTDYLRYNRLVLNNKGLSECSIIRLTNKYVKEANADLLAMITIAANVAVGEAAGAVGTPVGNRPKGIRPKLTTKSPVQNLQSFSGSGKATAKGQPNSIYTQLSGDGKYAVSNYVYNQQGEVIYQVDFGVHGNFASGHGHRMSTPGNLGSGHAVHVPPSEVPVQYMTIPKGVEYSVPIGQGRQ